MHTLAGGQRTARVTAGLLLAGFLALAGLIAPAQALTISGGSFTFTDQVLGNDTRTVTDTQTAGATTVTLNNATNNTNNHTISTTSTFNKFTASTGVLTAVSIALNSQVTHSMTLSGVGNDTTILSPATINATAAGQSNFSLSSSLGQSATFNAGLSSNCSASGIVLFGTDATCSGNVGTTTTAANGTIPVDAGSLNSYVGAGTFTATRSITSIQDTATASCEANDEVCTASSTYTLATWTASAAGQQFATTYTYLLHSLASFQNGSTVTSLTINFNTLDPDGIIHQGDGAGQLSTTYDIFNRGATDRTAMNMTSITPGGGNSSQLTTTLSLFSALAQNNSNLRTAFLNTTQVGTFSSTFTVHVHDNCPAGSASDTCLGDSDLNLTLTGTVAEPLPPSLMLMGAGLVAFAGTYAVRRRLRAA